MKLIVLFYFYPIDIPECGIGHSACDTIHHCDGSTALIASKNYPLFYFKTDQCTWQITTPAGTYISVFFIDFDVPSHQTSWGVCESTYINFFDGLAATFDHGLLGSYCNENPPPEKLISNFNEMLILFESGQENPGTGFLIQYNSEVLKPKSNKTIEAMKGM